MTAPVPNSNSLEQLPNGSWLATSPELAEQILLTHKTRFVKLGSDGKAPGLERLLGGGLLTNSDRDSWFKQRRIMQPQLFHQQLAPWAETIQTQTMTMLQTWQNVGEVALPAAFLDSALTLLYPLILGITTEDALNQDGSLIRLPLSLATAKKRHVRQVRERVDPIINRHIQMRRKRADGRCLLDALIAAKDADTGESMNDSQLRDEVATLFAAGHDTTAYALTWACILLAHHPQIQTRLQAEVDDFATGDDLAEPLERIRLPYLNALWQETLRLYPTIPAAPRVCLQDTTLSTPAGDVTIQQGQRMTVSIDQIHRNSEHWLEPHTFNPERFLENTPRHKLAYMPFGAGERFCVGRDLAQLQGRLLLAFIARHVTFERLEQLPKTRIAISLLPRDAVHLSVYARRSV